jgi:hypothetical protein
MTRIERHFAARPRVAVFAGSKPVPQPISPAIRRSIPIFILSLMRLPAAPTRWIRPSSSPRSTFSSARRRDSFKLYARDIMQHPIDARLVTISACYGSGTRSYAGEGLVGLSWAFLRAGAHSVIGALWEVSDDSTPRLMDTLYQGLEDGQTPAVALRNAQTRLAAFTEQVSRAVLLGPIPDLHHLSRTAYSDPAAWLLDEETRRPAGRTAAAAAGGAGRWWRRHQRRGSWRAR